MVPSSLIGWGVSGFGGEGGEGGDSLGNAAAVGVQTILFLPRSPEIQKNIYSAKKEFPTHLSGIIYGINLL